MAYIRIKSVNKGLRKWYWLSLNIDKRYEKINEAMSPGNGVDLFAIYEVKVISYKD